ncbi:MAG: radical SAM protein, partial [Bacteroides sp.]|nr:radical SAM protein [Bacteroides sp.]
MLDSYNRSINYLRISVTDRCNLRCSYCMPENGIEQLPHSAILSFEEILQVVEVAVELGINKVRLTGGEPLVRNGIVDLVRMLGEVDGIEDLSMTTNGILLGPMAGDLKAAGLHRVNVSLDTMDPVKYKAITRVGGLTKVLESIKEARKAGLEPIKINCVIEKDPSEPDARAVGMYGEENGLEVRFIRRMDLDTGAFFRVIGGDGGHCAECNRLRLTATGRVQPCLFNDVAFS